MTPVIIDFVKPDEILFITKFVKQIVSSSGMHPVVSHIFFCGFAMDYEILLVRQGVSHPHVSCVGQGCVTHHHDDTKDKTLKNSIE